MAEAVKVAPVLIKSVLSSRGQISVDERSNMLIVSGARPGTFGFKLVDYDGMYVPALAGASAEESGHVNYQHPARASDLTLSPDVDRFPVLVIATALKGLAVLGRKRTPSDLRELQRGLRPEKTMSFAKSRG